MNASPAETLASLRPTERLGIMELVRESGVDVSTWAVTKSGKPVATPQANPQFCYEWAFGGQAEPIVLCIWHESLSALGEQVVFAGNYRTLCEALERIALDRSYDQDIRSRAKSQAKRAYSFDFMLQEACRRNAPVRLIVVHGNRRDDSALGVTSSTVDVRRLDHASWWVHEYSEGDVQLVRDVPLPLSRDNESDSRVSPAYVDQFDLSPPSRGEPGTAGAFTRSPEVRRLALRRAEGQCELCGQSGFETQAGTLYLETHHVIP